MSEEQKAFIYKVEDIFEDIPDDPKNVNMTIPPEIMEKVGKKVTLSNFVWRSRNLNS